MTIPDKKHKGLKRIWNAFFYSVNGFKACYRTEEAFKQELVLALLLIPLGLYLGNTAIERLLLCGSLIFVLLVELLNTGIERAIDRISFEKHELSKESKDMGSAAVSLSILLCLFSWITILFF
ncbi:MAG: diacylglycerol kinase [Alphaproteobacteria bacterium CG_4_9_14_3_um_filter_47_13]|nr:MAG: diacylglycerol kinase [Alphaproteobacteria bacterium CG_4_9_14_3_um_filter_47_13]